SIDAVFEAVVLTDGPRGQFALLANGDEAAAKLVRNGAAENEAARLDPGDMVDPGRQEWPYQPVNGGPESGRAGDESRDIAKEDAGFRIVRDRPDQFFQVDPPGGSFHACPNSPTAICGGAATAPSCQARG